MEEEQEKKKKELKIASLKKELGMDNVQSKLGDLTESQKAKLSLKFNHDIEEKVK